MLTIKISFEDSEGNLCSGQQNKVSETPDDLAQAIARLATETLLIFKKCRSDQSE